MNRSRSQGFTLAELMVGIAVTSIILVAVASSVIGVQGSYQAEVEVSAVTENGRTALMYVDRVVRMAGYGIDPRLAVELRAVPTSAGTIPRDDYTVPGLTYPAGFTPPVVVTDDLAVRYRDPAFLRRGVLSGGQVTVDGAFDMDLPVGTLLMVACPGAAETAYARTTGAVAGGSVGVDTAAIAPFVSNAGTCLAGSGSARPYVMLIHEVRLRIVNLGNRPWLVAFRDLRADVTDVTQDNFDPIAPDIETFQVAFAMNRPASGGVAPDPGNSNWIFGDVPAESTFVVPADFATGAPTFETSYTDGSRFSRRPANVRGVVVALGLRSSRREPNGRKGFNQQSMLSWDAGTPRPDGYYRSVMHTMIETPNLASRSSFVPSLRANGSTADMNLWGG